MSPKNEDMQNNDSRSKLVNENSSSENTIFTFILFVIIINLLNRKSVFSDNNPQGEEYTVVIGENPAFPLEEPRKTIEKKAILDIKTHQDLSLMVNKLKPYMNRKNQKVINIFEKWQVLMKDIDELSTDFKSDNIHLETSKEEPKKLLGFLSDLKPFLHKDYHYQIEDFSQNINSILNFEKNIVNLQNTFNSINTTTNNDMKLNRLVDSIQPFMDVKQSETIERLKSLYKVIDVMNMTEAFSSKTNENNQDTSQLMEMLDLFEKMQEDDGNSQVLAKTNDQKKEIVDQEEYFTQDKGETLKR